MRRLLVLIMIVVMAALAGCASLGQGPAADGTHRAGLEPGQAAPLTTAADLTLAYTEEIVGSGHPTKTDTVNRLVLVEHNTDGTHKTKPLGFKSGLVASYYATDGLTFSAGTTDIEGTTYTLAATTNVTFTGLGANQSRWIYVSAPASGTTLTSSEFSSSTTAPTWSATYHGWYNGSDRCIFAIITNGSSQFVEFYCNGRTVIYDQSTTDASGITPSSSWTDVTLSVPVMEGLIALVTTYGAYSNTNANLYIRTNGSSASTGQRVGYVTANVAERLHGFARIAVDSAAKVELKYQSTTTNTASVWTDGFELMEGM